MEQVQVLSPVGEERSHMTCGQKTKAYNRNISVTNAIKCFKIVHIKKKILKEKKKKRMGYIALREQKWECMQLWSESRLSKFYEKQNSYERQ